MMTRLGMEAEQRWLQWYDPAVPRVITVPDEPLARCLSLRAAQYANRPVIRFMGRSLPYRDLEEAVNRFANALHALGVKPNDRVGLLMPNCPQMVIAFFGVWRAGAVAVPVSPLAVEDEVRNLWGEAEVRAAVTISSFYPMAQRVRSALPSLEHLIVTNIKQYFPPLTRLLFTVFKEHGRRVQLPQDRRTHWLNGLLAASSPCNPEVSVSPDSLALLQPTGGTTGTPKLAMLTHRNLLANAVQVRAWLGSLAHEDGSNIVLGVVPLFHIYGITTVLTFSVVSGATMILQPRFVVKDVLEALEREKPDFFPGVPTMYVAINHAHNVQKYSIHSLKAAISGAAPLPTEVQIRFEQLTGARLVEGYGLTEAGPVTHCTPLYGRRKLGSIGVPIPGTDARVFDQETGTRVLPDGEIGELAVRGPQVMTGYWRRAEETAQVLRDGWLFTGDLATRDDEGFFAIVDRKKDLIITGGMNVYPRDVEEPLYAHPKVKEAVAVGIPDKLWGEAVKVYIVLNEGQTATAQEIIDYCYTRMARYKVPKFVEFRQSLPETIIGKVLRRQLLEEEVARSAEQSVSFVPLPRIGEGSDGETGSP